MRFGFTDYLRDIAVRCDRLARTCAHDRTKRELEKLSLELAEKAVEFNSEAEPATPLTKEQVAYGWRRISFTPLEISLSIIATCTLILWAIDVWFDPPHLVFVYLAPILYISSRYGSRAGMQACIASVLGAIFFLYPPKLSIYVVELQ